MAAGIYRLFCVVSSKSYVGQSKNVVERVGKHFWSLSRGCHTNLHLQRSFDLHGHDAFLAEVLEYCNEDVLTEREQHWMDYYGTDSLYNICPAARSTAGIKYSDEVRAKMSEAKKGNQNAKGHKHCEESRQRISESKKGKKHPPVSEERRQQLSEARKVRWARYRAEKEATQ